jgi:hypothetical protein
LDRDVHQLSAASREPCHWPMPYGLRQFPRTLSSIPLTKLWSRQRAIRNMSNACRWFGRRKICNDQFFLGPRLPDCLTEFPLPGDCERYLSKRTFRILFSAFLQYTTMISRVMSFHSLRFADRSRRSLRVHDQTTHMKGCDLRRDGRFSEAEID